MKKKIFRKKEEILADLKKNKDFQEKMKFTREVFYPALCNASKNIEDATMFIGSISTVMMEKFLQLMKEKKFSELKLTDSLDTKDEKYNELKEMLDLFNDMSVFDARTYFEGMKSEISLFIQEENKDRPLSDLKTKWLDQE